VDGFAVHAVMVGSQVIRHDGGADNGWSAAGSSGAIVEPMTIIASVGGPADPAQQKTLNGADHKR